MAKHVFHQGSKEIYNWYSAQPTVKEESLTDRLLFHVSTKRPEISYYAFNHHEEAQNGCDWDWWVLLPDAHGSGSRAYHFFVQAKKLTPGDNARRLAYTNVYGKQADLLIETAGARRAFPFYMFYSLAKADLHTQIANNRYWSAEEMRKHRRLKNGCYLADACSVYPFTVRTHQPIAQTALLNISFPLSLCDTLFELPIAQTRDMLEAFNMQWMNSDLFDHRSSDDRYSLDYGIRFLGASIPSYVIHLADIKQEWQTMYPDALFYPDEPIHKRPLEYDSAYRQLLSPLEEYAQSVNADGFSVIDLRSFD